MTDPNFMILYVDDPMASAGFYTELLGRQPVEATSGFVLFVLASGLKLGLWGRHKVEPAATAGAGGGELAFPVADKDTVDSIYADWGNRRLPMVQMPCQMDFGYTFVALDPDGHRLRVFAPS